MRNTIFAVLLVAAASVFADLPIDSSNLKPVPHLLLEEKLIDKQGFFYVRFALAESDLARARSILPGLGFGYRRLAGHGAADISVSGIGHAERKGGRIFWTAPRASYIYYFQPDAKRSVYAGGGLAWGGIAAKERNFIGLIPNVTVGYELAHQKSFLGFVEFAISQPAMSVSRKGIFPGPIAEFSTGIGF